ncbi:hypothetical protein BOO71_0010861 [Deinococcus marmoris]|uniref:Beta-ketoadipate enol-lactone hydrolase n=1 Tax=Deinococcus marmoris TaxID=249408 RepID=A0A1U7NV35_9DEIO|nr:hypothetical protein BOO71_0010861 [Deinococcus marmoris]
MLWGESDQIGTPAYAAAFLDAQFQIIERAGHLPQIEQPSATFALIDNFLESQVQRGAELPSGSTVR